MTALTLKERRNPALDRPTGTSTNYNAKYAVLRFIPAVEIEYPNGFIEVAADALDWRLTSLLNSITDFQPVRYDGSEPFTTMVYRYYGFTTLWWLVLCYNGFMHPLEIRPGTLVRMPSITQIDSYLKEVKVKTGKVVTI